MNPIRVLIADDDAGIREALALLVDSDPGMTVVGSAAGGAEALELAAARRPDVVLMDVQMPGMGGLEAARILAGRGAVPRVVMLTVFDLDEYVFEALRAGASGFLVKNCPPAEILHAVRVAHAGEALLAPSVTRRLVDRYARRDPVRAGEERGVGRLTERERETLTLIGRGLSNAEVAETLFVTPTTVRTYVSRVLSKLGARDRAQLVVIAYESGLVGGTDRP